MRLSRNHAVVLGAVVVLVSGCASSDQWAEWKGHSTHFASGHHMGFSLRNTEGSAPHVRRSDVEKARAETWWGRAVTVSPDQIFQS